MTPPAATGDVSIVVPTIGRPSLNDLLRALAASTATTGWQAEIVLVNDRVVDGRLPPVPPELAGAVRVVGGRGTGPAAARNTGWRAATGEWIAFLDDDVVPGPDWLAQLVCDLRVDGDVGGVQGEVRVPLPAHRRPTDWERQTSGLARARWITADMAYRREVLARVGGFDERFTRAYREDCELAYRVAAAGWRLVTGRRTVTHPVRQESTWVSLRAQRGNADDALLRRIYGPGWHRLLGLPRGRRAAHVCTTVALATTVVCGLAGLGGPRARRVARPAAAGAGACVLAITCQFALARIRAGPLHPRECGVMLVTSAAIPPLATLHWLRGWWSGRGAARWTG